MEARKETLISLQMCRFCLSTSEPLVSLYQNKNKLIRYVPFALKILTCIAVEVFPSDKMPQFICRRCKFFIEIGYAFKHICRQADEMILQYIQNGTPLPALSMPSQLLKAYRATNKISSEVGVMKTITPGGATVQVMAEEVTDSEEGEDVNVYNVKIGDGTEEGKSIKVITTDKTSKRSRKESLADSNEGLASVIEDRACWACDECDCTYPLEQLLLLHQAQKHRSRKLECEECDAKFSNKYNLMNHQLTHSNEFPFQCYACKKKFKRLVLLKRHEKILHPNLPQLPCPNCPATFLSEEELEEHQKRHDIPIAVNRPFYCRLCEKRFHSKILLQRHIDSVHKKKPSFSCQYCTEQFLSVSKLTKHVREHAGGKLYPCKHCDKSFTKSHHYTRHLRVKHFSARQADAYADTEVYQCEECEDTFADQDDLMYHSALHATKNLTCPLCQEKFKSVETVTAHIKSHGTGTEFMCDYCELIFTSKEKLDCHMAMTHDEELANEQEAELDESSMEMDAEEDDPSLNVKQENGHMVVEIKKADEYMLPDVQIQKQNYAEKVHNSQYEVKQEKGHMVVEIKKADDYMLPDVQIQKQNYAEKVDNSQYEDSEVDVHYIDSVTTNNSVTTLTTNTSVNETAEPDKASSVATINKLAASTTLPPTAAIVMSATEKESVMTPPILRKAEEIKRRALLQKSPTIIVKKDKKPVVKAEGNSTVSGASEKSLRLLEKELQDLKRTNSRAEVPKTPIRIVESLKNRRVLPHTSTPKPRAVEKKELTVPKPAPEKVMPVEKKLERKLTKENKEPKEIKTSNNNSLKDDKELKETKEKANVKEEKEKTSVNEEKEATKEAPVDKETPKSVKNGADEKSSEELVRRSTRPSKIKDYAKMIRDSSQNSDEDIGSDEEPEEDEYKEMAETSRGRTVRLRRSSVKVVAASPAAVVATVASSAAASATVPPRKRGRPRKDTKPVVPNKVVKKDESEDKESDPVPTEETVIAKEQPVEPARPSDNVEKDGEKTPEPNKSSADAKANLVLTPTGQTLKQVPIKSLPPGVKPLPLPMNSRMSGGEVCEMQIGKKMVKVQKIVMTKAEVEAMAKKGLLEMKDGTMVLKQGIKLPAADPTSLKSTFVGDGELKKESPVKATKSAPTRVDLEED